MAAPFRLKKYSRKPTAGPLPRLPCDYLTTIHVDGVCSLYLQFWRPTLFGRRDDGWIQKSALDSLATDYFFSASHEEPPSSSFSHHYTAVLANDSLAAASQTFLQLGMKAKFRILVRRRSEASFVISTAGPAGHILSHFFPGVKNSSARAVERLVAGKAVNPRRLSRLSLPPLIGVGEAGPSGIPPVAPAPPPPGAIVLGDQLSSFTGRAVGPAWILRNILTRGTIIAGTTGGGKTNTGMMLAQAVRDSASVLILDPKREYRSLYRTMGATVWSFTGTNRFSLNVLKPVGPPAEYLKQFGWILAQIIFRNSPAQGAKDMTIQESDRLYRTRGIYEGGTNYPHLGDLTEALRKRAEEGGREASWSESALRVLGSLGVGSTKDAFFVREGFALERLLEGVHVIELDGLGDPAAASLLVSVLLQKIRNHLQQKPPTDELRHLILIEEAQNLLAQGQEATSVLTTTCREIRAMGVGLVYLTQSPSELSKHAIANVSTIISHKLVHPADKSMMSNILGLESEQRELLEDLRVGEAIMKGDRLAQIRVPPVARPVVRDDELPVVRPSREELARSFVGRATASARLDLPVRVLEVFDSIAHADAVFPTAIATKLNFSQDEKNGALTTLIGAGLVGYCKAKRLDRRGRPPSIYFLSPLGEEAARQRIGTYADRKQDRSPNHADLVAFVLARLSISRKPHPRFDILYEENGQDRAIEVETGSNNNDQILENLRKSLEFQGEGRFVVADRRAANGVQQVVAREAFTARKRMLVRIAKLASLPVWETYEFQPVPSTT